MNNDKQASPADATIALSVFIVFLVFKLTGVINWHWVWVVSPLWIWVAWIIIQYVVLTPIIMRIIRKHAYKKAQKLKEADRNEKS